MSFLFCILLSMFLCVFLKKNTEINSIPLYVFSVSSSFCRIFCFSSFLIMHNLIKWSETLSNYLTFGCRIRCLIWKNYVTFLHTYSRECRNAETRAHAFSESGFLTSETFFCYKHFFPVASHGLCGHISALSVNNYNYF